MNKHELKSLLENIYTVLTEADAPDNPPVPSGWDQNSPEPWPWPKNSPPATTPVTPPPAPPLKIVYPPIPSEYDQWIEFFGRWIQLYN